ncbi:Crotonobetainyl-CoA:carnitine CoA-transferase CaiB [Micromonospora haikouensis]|uniref:Crotonobetainyl-CoA:carnitine CoA-transferase CaiB n=1 Tax=Micromonospora haikouensis TaxID=686309 RepID=A0A1C4XKD6_9ACTN|nr:CaiB/BaiF CoA-transferase family protein [Micromonospora haikouensis]SCF08989.1 Crotonobetainyl-CoA:carnitine CoA-transferase CaiB [Micromonospora haikouensis]
MDPQQPTVPGAGEPAPLPLAGVTVVALEQAVAAPLATRHLADLGARVVKVERPQGGDFARGYDASIKGLSSHFVWLNRGKQSVALDLKTPGGREALAALVAGADVFVQNLAPGAAGRLGFGAADLRARHPRLVTVDMSGYGGDGPYGNRRAYDMLVQCEAALVSVTGWPDRPAKTGIPASDIAAGMYALSSVLAALLRRASTGLGAQLEVSMLEATGEWMGFHLYFAQGTGHAPDRMGLSHASVAPYDAFPTADGPDVMIGVQNDREWARFATDVLGRPHLATDPAWATNEARVRNRAGLNAVVAGITSTRDGRSIEAALEGAGIAYARLGDVTDLLSHPQLAHRGRWRPVQTPAGVVRGLLPPFTIAGVELPMGPVPALGEHTEVVLRELGFPAERIAALRAGEATGAPRAVGVRAAAPVA